MLVKWVARAAYGCRAGALSPAAAEAESGSGTELLGASLISPADVQAADFGVLLTVTATASGTPRVDAISITVHFDDPACPN